MSNLRAPSLGPIVGHTTSHSVRAWMRGSTDSPGRTVGVGALYDANDNYVPNSAAYVRLHREYDRTGLIDFDDLTPNAAYTIRFGSLTLDSAEAEVDISDEELWSKLPKPDAWLHDLADLPEGKSIAQFTTYPEQNSDGISFLFGSCRYPGLLWSAKKADQIFGSMLEHIQNDATGRRPRFVLMMGDQIYADKLNRAIPVGLANTPSEFHERYSTAFGTPNMRALLRQTPTYMILDDHEIEDNWVKGRLKQQEKRDLFQMAISAYMSYQWLHSPRNYDQWGEAPDNDGRRLYYSFECAGYPFFVMDSRTQRIRDDDDYVLEDNHLLGHPAKDTAPEYLGQIDLLCQWLVAQQEKFGSRPKFLVSPSVFVPNGVETAGDSPKSNRKKCEDDAWAAFPNTRRQLLRTILERNVENVVFLSGDVHCSNVAEIRFVHRTQGELPLRAYSITSSAFYWPWAFADGDPLSFVHDSGKEGDDFAVNNDVVMSYRARAFEQEDNFTRVDVTPDRIIASNYARDGRLLEEVSTFDLIRPNPAGGAS